jgi:hypothetical protein
MELIIAIVGLVVSVITVSLTNYYIKENQLGFEKRKLKEVYYTDFIEAVSLCVVSNNSEEARDKFADSQNKLLLIGSSIVVEKSMIFQDYIESKNNDFSPEKHDELLRELLKAMREDLFLSSKVNKNYPQIHLTAKNKKNGYGQTKDAQPK